MNCPHCGKKMTPVNHNNRGWRCGFCWELLLDYAPQVKPDPDPEPEAAPKSKPKRRTIRRKKAGE